MHNYMKEVAKEFVHQYLEPLQGGDVRILDVGSMTVSGGSFKELFSGPGVEYVGLDLYEGQNVDIVVKSPYAWVEIPDASFDVVVSGSTLEHAEFFWLTAIEMARVLRPGGMLLLTVPSEGPVHRHPQDCWRFKEDGMRALAKWAGLEVLSAWTNDTPASGDTEDLLWKDSVLLARKPSLIEVAR